MSPYERWQKSPCCCHAPDGRECYRSRHSVHPDNFGDGWGSDDDCECACHGEYYQDLEDAGEYEDAY